MLETVYTRALPQLGYKISWVMPSGQDAEIKGWQQADWNGTTVFLLKNDLASNPLQKLWGRFFDQYRVVKHLIERGEVDILQVRTDWIGGLIGVYAQKKWGIPFVFQNSFPMPEWWLAQRGWRRGVGWLWKKVELFIIKHAALVFPISQWMKQSFESDGIQPEKMVVLPLGVDVNSEGNDKDGHDIRARYNLGNDPVMIYFGEMGRTRQLDFLIRVMKIVFRAVPSAHLLMVGKSAGGEREVDWLKGLSDQAGLRDKIIFTGHVPRADVSKYLIASDISVSPIVPLPAYVLSSPTKLVESLNMARPVIANDIPEQKMIIDESRAGVCVPYEEDAFAQAVIWLLDHPLDARRMGELGREYIRERRSYDILSMQVDHAYRTLLASTIGER